MIGIVEPPESGQAYPGQTALVRASQRACPSIFTSYVGSGPGAAGLKWSSLIPTFEEWTDQHFYVIACTARRQDDSTLTASVKA